MAITPITELNDRTRNIFRMVVESYLDSGAPVGSRTISKFAGLNLSPASIRNVMQDLEEAGLLAAPHTSAGRMPTETGLRLFVDGMMQAAEPSAAEQRAIESQIKTGGPIELALNAATQVLSGLSACAGLVLVPKREVVLRQFSFVRISDNQALAILVGSDNQVENRIVAIEKNVSESALIEASNYISAQLSGLTLSDAVARLDAEIRAEKLELDKVSADLVRKGLAMWSLDANDRPVLIVKGQSNLLDEAAAADLDRVRQLLDELENKEEIARLVDSARDAQSARIFIGSENNLFSLSGSSIIAAPYREAGGKVVGVVGVIGPTRLNYARIVPMVDFTAQTLSRLMK
jgi:heat-inducible transcriptional repressor